MQTSVLLSVKPKFAEAILNGTKRFEFRRLIFKNGSVRKVVLYASSPVQKVVGEFALDSILTMTPLRLWQATKPASGINFKYFLAYFRGRSVAYALKVADPRRYAVPLDLKAHFGVRRPPQSFCYLTSDSPNCNV